MWRALLISFVLTAPASLSWAQEGQFLDADAAFETARTQGRNPAGTVDEVVALMAGDAPYTVLMDGKEWIRRNDVPVRVRVSGAWGDYETRCRLPFGVVQQKRPDGSYDLRGNLGGSELLFGYRYREGDAGRAVNRYLDDPPDELGARFVSGDFLVGPGCIASPPGAPDMAENARIRELQDSNIACAEALLELARALAWNAPVPAECINAMHVAQAYAQDTQINGRNIEMMQRCTLEVAENIGQPGRISDACKGWMESYSDTLETALGLCEMGGAAEARLLLIDPRPHHFKAHYSFSFERVDCKGYLVEVFIDLPDSEDFTFAAVLPEPDECLSVEYISPVFRLVLSEEPEGGDLTEHIRLQAIEGGSERTVPISVTRLGGGVLDITPQVELRPMTRHWLEVRQGEEGLRSRTDKPLMIDPLQLGPIPQMAAGQSDAFTPVTWFRTVPFSDPGARADGLMELRAGVYQVARDAELLRDRPTATRVWLDWEAPPGDEDAVFCGRFRVRDAETEASLYPPLEKQMRVTSAYSDEDRRMAVDTANLFDWRPGSDAKTLVISVEPQRYWLSPDVTGEPPRLEDTHDVSVRVENPVHLTMKYGFFRALEWENNVPVEALTRISAHMQAARRYTWQSAPIGSAGLERVGSVTMADLGLHPGNFGCMGPTCSDAPEVQLDSYDILVEWAARRFAQQNCPDADQACFLWVPGAVGNHHDVTSIANARGAYVSAFIVAMPSPLVKGTELEREPISLEKYRNAGSDLAHELGHSFGLQHVPRREAGNDDYKVYTSLGGVFPGIDGVRMHPSGISGYFKSSETGNSEHRLMLAPLMFPRVLPTGASQVLDDHYRLWMDRMMASAVAGEVFDYPDVDEGPSHRLATGTFRDVQPYLSRQVSTIEGPTREAEPLLPQVIGRDRAGTAPAVPGVEMRFVMRQGAAGVGLLLAAQPQTATRTPAAITSSGPGIPAQVLLTLGDGGRVTQDFRLRDLARMGEVIHQDVTLFLPLDDAADVRHIALSVEDVALWEFAIPELPAADAVLTLADGAADAAVLSWDGPAAGAPFVASFVPEAGEARRIGGGADAGSFTFSPQDLGLRGAGAMEVTFDNGFARRMLRGPARFATPLVALQVTPDDEGAGQGLVVTFNRPLAANLPDFALLADDEIMAAVPVQARVEGSLLYLQLMMPLDPCVTYRLRPLAPLMDTTGLAQRRVVEWPLTGPPCDTPEAVTGASLEIARGDDTRAFKGDAVITGTVIRLDFARQRVFLELPRLSAGTYGLANAGRGEARGDVVLGFDETETEQGALTLTGADGQWTGRFTATLSGSTLEGEFVVNVP